MFSHQPEAIISFLVLVFGELVRIDLVKHFTEYSILRTLGQGEVESRPM